MKKIFNFIFIFIVLGGLGYGSYNAAIYWPNTAGPYRNPTKWHLIFEEEFDGTTLNLSRWSFNYPESSYNGGHTHNHEGYMATENVLIENGILRLKAENKRHPDAPRRITLGVVGL